MANLSDGAIKQPSLDDVRLAVAAKLAEIAELFVPGMKLTLLARLPGSPESELIVTEDEDLKEVVAALERLRERAAVRNGKIPPPEIW